ncbi:MAG TPA: PxKF domain-containing protein [Gaiellaceae bacterium]
MNPTGGTSLSGIPTLAVNASDNVGVDHVTYEYYDPNADGGPHTYLLGSSSAGPFYNLSFNTTAFPDRATNSATIYATAYDAAGNASIKTGVGVGIANNAAPVLGTVHASLDNDYIFLQGFWPNSDVTLNVFAPQEEIPATYTIRTNGDGDASVPPPAAGRDLTPGWTISADDGRGAKSVTLVNLHIAGVDTSTRVVTGTAPAGANIRAFLFTTNGGAQIAGLNTTADANGNWSGVFDVAAVTGGMHVLADTDYVANGTPDGDRTRADFDVPLPQTSITITGDGSDQAGAASASIQGIPTTAITGAQNGGPSGAPLGGIPLGGIPLGGIPLGGIPLGGIPLGGIGLTPDNLKQNGLGGVPLSTIPLKAPDSWQSRIDANATFKGTPAQSLTLSQVINTPIVDGVDLEDLDLAGSPLGGIPLGGIALGGLALSDVPLGGIPLGGIPLGGAGATPLQGWCDYINRQPGFSCSDPTTLQNQTVIGLALQGVPLGGIPLGGIPLGGIPLGGIPLGGIPIGTPLGGIPLGGIDLTGTPLGGIPLGGIPLGGIPLGGIPLGGIPTPGAVLTCTVGTTGCTGTLSSVASQISPDAKVQDIGYYCIAGAPTDTNACKPTDRPLTLAELAASLPNATLEDLIGTVVSKSAYDWEGLPIPGFPIQDFSNDGGENSYTVTYSADLSGSGAPLVQVTVNLPAGARYEPNTTLLNGRASYLDGEITVPVPEPTLDEAKNQLQWDLPAPLDGTPQVLTFKAKPGLTLGTETADAGFDGAGIPTTKTATPAATQITQTFAGTADEAKIIAPDTLYFGYTPNGNDRDFFQLPLPQAGTLVTLHLSHLHVDDDLVVYGPTVDPLRVPKPGTATTVAPNTIPSLQQRTQAIQPEVLADVPINPPTGQSVIGVSDNRGLADESVTFTVPEHSTGAYATIQVTSYDDGYSNEPWMLRAEEDPLLPLPATCSASPSAYVGTTKPLPGTVGGSTLYLFNSKRFGDLYGPTLEDSVWSKLQTLAGRTDAAGGTVIPVDAVPAVQTALSSWYGDACSPGSSNDVVRAIGKYLDNVSGYKYVVLVGSYDVLPPGLVLDDTSYVNEREYAPTFLGGTDNLYLSAYAHGYLPTDDPYGDTSYSGTGAYIPEAAVGRLVETPAQITSQIDQYVTRNGAVNPTTALVTGYDFLSDGATTIANNLKPHVPSPTTLINETWTKSNLIGALFPSSNPPLIDSINAHYDHRRLLPADQNTANTQTNLVTTSDIGSAAGRIVITMGCHSGVSVSDLIPNLLGADWDQTYAAQGALGYIANTGFGLGETAGVAYSEQLHALVAQRLDGSMTLGQALTFAKQEYAGSVPTTSGYHLKVIDEADLFGLPMYKVGTGNAPATPNPPPVVTDITSGLAATTFSVAPSYTQVNAPTGNYYTVNGAAAYENRRPIEPLIKLDVSEPNLVAHGALVTGLASTDTPNFDAAFSRVVEDRSAFSPELVGDLAYPTKLQAITSFAQLTGQRQRLLLYGGQYRSDNTPDALGVGIQRLFTSLSGIVLYAPPTATDFNAPTFGPVNVSAPDASTIGFAVDINDDSGVDGVKRVVALYNDDTGTWRSIDLSHTTGSPRWSGAGAFHGTTSEWFVQAVDGAGNVGVTSNKATVRSVTPPSPTGGLTITLAAAAAPTNGWFTGDVSATLAGAAGLSYSVDGAPFTSGSTTTVTGTGVHTVDAQGSDGSHASALVPIDVTPPTISIASGIVSKTLIPPVVCNDAGSGIATCDITPSPFDTLGQHTVHVHAVDRVGNVADADGTYTLDLFDGFNAPVDNPPILNVVKAGSSVPVKFSLGLNMGLAIFAAGYPKVQQNACESGAPQDAIIDTTTANSGLTYDATTNTYNYVWKTTSSWSGTCRTLIIKLTDGTEHRANFKFK